MFVYNIDNENINYISMSHISHFCVKNDKLVLWFFERKRKILRKIYKSLAFKILEFLKIIYWIILLIPIYIDI